MSVAKRMEKASDNFANKAQAFAPAGESRIAVA